MSSVVRTIFLILVFSFAGQASAENSVCDVDSDGDIDIKDIQLIVAARNQPAASPPDPRDADRDGIITVLDARACTLSCTLPGCAEPPPNNAPLADAGEDQRVDAGDTVRLDGSGSSDADGDPLTFSWSITSSPPGSTASLSDTSAVFPTFVADLAGEYRIGLRVNDGKADSAPDEVIVTTIQGNRPPVAEAGPDQSVLIGDTVFLDGSASSDADLDPLTFSWNLSTVPAGSNATFNDPTLVNPSFFVDLPGEYVAELTVSDGLASSSPDKVTISTANSRPVADAGPDQAVTAGEPVQLDGSGSFDADRDPLTFSWSLTTVPAGSAAALDGRSLPSPTLTTDLVGIYVAQLIVNDGRLDSVADTVVIVARDGSAPTAVLDLRDTGGQPILNNRVPFGDDFILDGARSSDIGGVISTYLWTWLDTGIQIETAFPSINASLLLQGATLAVGRHDFELVVVDDSGNQSQPARISVLVVDVFAPTAVLDLRDTGGQPIVNNRIPFGDDFILDGSRSTDIGGQIDRYSWDSPSGSIPFSVTTVIPTIDSATLLQGVTLPVGRHDFRLVVRDDSGNESTPATVTVVVIDQQAPTAVLEVFNASGQLASIIPFGETFTLSGQRSSDIGGQIDRYSWDSPSGSIPFSVTTVTPTIDSATLLQGVTLPVGRHDFRLVVRDDSGNLSTPATVSVVVIDQTAPTAVAELRDTNGQPLTGNRLPFGGDFILDGSRSSDSGGGSIFSYHWTLIDSFLQGETRDSSINASLLLRGTTLALGRHDFELVVVDDSGNRSRPALVTVIVEDRVAPTAVLDLRDADGRPVFDGRVPFGEDFILNGSRSSDSGGGSIASYAWTSLTTGVQRTSLNSLIRVSLLLLGDGLAPGQHVFRLEVTDDSGNRSQPASLSVLVEDPP